jgi:hypothetical protein
VPTCEDRSKRGLNAGYDALTVTNWVFREQQSRFSRGRGKEPGLGQINEGEWISEVCSAGELHVCPSKDHVSSFIHQRLTKLKSIRITIHHGASCFYHQSSIIHDSLSLDTYATKSSTKPSFTIVKKPDIIPELVA